MSRNFGSVERGGSSGDGFWHRFKIWLPRNERPFKPGKMFKSPSDRIKGAGKSGLRGALIRMNLPKAARALDIGAGGFVGKTTTVHLLDFCEAVDAIELDPVGAAKLRDAFRGRDLNVIEGSAFEVQLTGPYDVIVSDLDSALIPRQASSLAERCRAVLKPGGYYVSVFIFDPTNIYGGEKPLLDPTFAPALSEFLTASFGTADVTADNMAPFYRNIGYEVCGLINKWVPSASMHGIGWLVLKAI